MKEFGWFEVILLMIAVGLITLYSVKVYDYRGYDSRLSNLEMDVQHLEEEEMGMDNGKSL